MAPPLQSRLRSAKLALMVMTESTDLELGSAAPRFRLPDAVRGNMVSSDDFSAAPALLVMFICNHCPYVKHLRNELAAFCREYRDKGLAIVAINSNDVARYPADHPDRMKEEAAAADYTFPYLFDDSQEVAKAYQAACTPDFYLFDRQRKLAYHGQFDGSRPNNGKHVTGADLRAAADAVLAGKPLAARQVPSQGCNIKWREGNEPPYFGIA